MTDNNADETDRQNSKLSRRTALGLMGASAVGGAAATGAFSELTADRPIDVAVVENGDVETDENVTAWELHITNNAGEPLNASIAANESEVYSAGLSGTSTADFDISTLNLGNLSDGETAKIEFYRNSTNTNSSSVRFDVEAFSDTNGYTIGTEQVTTVNHRPEPIAHYDATKLGLTDSDAVSTLPDFSGNGYDLSQGTGSLTPSYVANGINGKPSISFDESSGEYLQADAVTINQPDSWFLVLDYNASKGQFVMDSGTSNNRQSLLVQRDTDSDGNLDDMSVWGGNSYSIPDVSDTSSPQLVAVFWNGSNSKVRIDGNTVSPKDAGTNNLDILTLGAKNDASNSYDGQMGEVIGFNRALDSTEVAQVEQYLANKWGLTLS